jgi:hypothetical protein
MRSGLAVLVLSLLTVGTARAECLVGRFQFFPGVTTDAAMSVTSGRACGIIIRASARSNLREIRTVTAPRHGTLTSRSGVGVTYRSRSGYKGQDFFAHAVTGDMYSGSGTATIRVAVTVK